MEKITVTSNRPSIKYRILKTIAGAFNPIIIKASRKRNKENTPIQNSYKTNVFTYWTKAFKQQYINGLQTFVLNENANKCIVYFHGGAYISGPAPQHFKFLKQLSNQTNYKIYLVIYPRLPNYTCADCFNLLHGWFNEIPEKDIILGGDSSGGGLAIAVQKYLIENNLKIVDKVFTLSPWMDVFLNNTEIKNKEKLDNILDLQSLKYFGANWATNLDEKSYFHSPKHIINKDNIPKLIISGSHEILTPDIEEYCNNNKNSNILWYEFDKLQHVFLLYPCKEAKNATQKIIDFLKTDKKF